MTSSNNFVNASVRANDVAADDIIYQREILQRVSRIRALAIPLLPKPYDCVVENAYSPYRITETIEINAILNEKR